MATKKNLRAGHQQMPRLPDVSRLAARVSLFVGAIVLAGWWFGIERLVRPLPALPGMVPNTAIAFMLAGLALFILTGTDRHSTRRRAAYLPIALVIVYGAITLTEYLLPRDLGIDHIFIRAQLEANTGFPSGRSAPGTAAAFMLLGLAMATLDFRPAVRRYLPDAFAAGAALISMLVLAGYVYGATALYSASGAAVFPRTGVAPHTTLCLLLLSAGVVCARPNRVLTRLVTSPLAGGLVVRRLLLGAFVIPLVGLLVLTGQRGSLYGGPFAAALFAVICMAMTVGFVLATGRLLDRVDAARTASERALAEREERLHDVIEKASDGVFIADLDGRYVEVNQAGCRMLGYRRDEIIGKTIKDLIPASDVPKLEVARQALLGGDVQVDEWNLKRSDGTYLPVEVSAKILPGGRWQGMVRDISIRKMLERQRDEWTTVVAHDLRQPIGVILVDGDTVARLFANRRFDECQKSIDRIRRSARRLDRMIDDLLDMSRIETRHLALERTHADLAEWLDDAIERLSLLASGHPLRLRTRLRPARVFVDPARIEQVLANLITNAAKYGEPHGDILVDLSGRGDEVEVAVTNRGQGIPPEDLPNLFQRFTRSASTEGSGISGLGLGLYICKGLVEAHGGRIRAESVPGSLTTIAFTLPALSVGEPRLERGDGGAKGPPSTEAVVQHGRRTA